MGAGPAGDRTLDMDYSLTAWTAWTAVNGKLPPAVCGTSVTASQLQARIFGHSTPDPW